jgi:ketosteroid isomerase-like protein
MIGALFTRWVFCRAGEALSRRDIDYLMRFWADDGVFEFGGTSDMAGRRVGKAEIRSWFERWFARMDRLEMRIGRVAVARPWALGLTNTVMAEFTVEETSHDGVTVHAEGVSVYDVQRGRIVRARDYLFDETPELVMWGAKRTGGRRGADLGPPRSQPAS